EGLGARSLRVAEFARIQRGVPLNSGEFSYQAKGFDKAWSGHSVTGKTRSRSDRTTTCTNIAGRRFPGRPLPQQRLDRLALAELHRPADGGRVRLLRVEANRLEHGGVDVGGVDRVGRVLPAPGVGGADDAAALDAAAGERHAEALRPVVAAAQRVHLRRPP